ncbi:hypothetical protein E8E13_008165 [Curvularia kusanoi]|uniref:Uncharacterized protein n=1 Tax=Curvularia kusanoi TaxID=90978 RepID=A0A9P4TFT9_CURKU|nr:hypothetical protein E8E13_008165 [Curvularia kusanoi]
MSVTPTTKDLAAVTVFSESERSKQINKSFDKFLSFVLTLTIFGASTFTVVVSEIANPSEINPSARFARETVRSFLGIAWLLFVIALYGVAYSMSSVAEKRENPDRQVGGKSKFRWELLASSLIQIVIITAFLFLSLALVAYVEPVGWAAVASSSAAGALTAKSLVDQWGQKPV